MVDDEELDRILLARLLSDAGVRNPCRSFTSGELLIDALIEVLRGAPAPVACFLDVKMPGMTGFDVLRWIRCQRACDDVSVVMLSSSDQQRDLHEAQHHGAQCYVTKYPTVEHLRAILREADRVASASTAGPFRVPCNLLLSTSQATC